MEEEARRWSLAVVDGEIVLEIYDPGLVQVKILLKPDEASAMGASLVYMSQPD
ncbi:hypothetical protein [Chenggangzhangella methanolivorans]|uniref:Uncharacterized protein n=1 Tax=Chenggangzhangella methanolivorans TaxID=1437009 RepID=A0A9E6RER1_9HYPH|nr:hypothetical protein [Chenggangzhangella methanolivorans]QZN99571.1 hypothetical protein K6K41_23155 [Chenggangzhangella methanolivorans]